MRANINLYKDEDVIAQLEAQLGGLSLNEGQVKAGKSPNDIALDQGKAVVGGQTRKVVKAKRQTDEAILDQKRQEKIRKRDTDLFKASLKTKGEVADADDDSDWEDVEEDYPGVKLSELLDGLTLEVGGGEDDDYEDEQVQDASGKKVQFAASNQEESKQ